MCNRPYSGTQVIQDYGDEHMQSGALIVYTSADSVFQMQRMRMWFRWKNCIGIAEIARRMLQGDLGVGRVIARPFVGTSGHYTRTSRRHDFSLEPPQDTMLDVLKEAEYDVIGVGKTTIFLQERVLQNLSGHRTMRMVLRRHWSIWSVNSTDSAL